MIKPKKLYFTTAGIPIRTKGDVIDGLRDVKEMDLDGMELEFVRGVRTKPEKAKQIGQVAEENDLILTAHGPYYINLNSKELEKIDASINRIFQTAKITSIANGYSITFHAAYYMKSTPSEVYKKVRNGLKEVIERMEQEGFKIWIRPELTGKPTQFGNVDELIKLSQEFDHVLPCIDFAHFYARYVGQYNSKDAFRKQIFDKIEKELGTDALKNFHAHMSGIVYGNKGEKYHEPLKQTKFNWKAVIELMKEYNIKGVVVSESPNIEEDAMLMKKYYFSL